MEIAKLTIQEMQLTMVDKTTHEHTIIPSPKISKIKEVRYSRNRNTIVLADNHVKLLAKDE